MSIQHRDIPDAQLHEPKGAAAAASGAVYVANGIGGGVWTIGDRYAELYITAGVTGLALPAANAFTRLDPGAEWKAGVASGLTVTPADGTFTIDATGAYSLSFWATFSTASLASGTRYNFKYAVNGVVAPRQLSTYKTSNGVDTLSVSATGLSGFTAGDVVSIYVGGDATSSGTSITVVEAGFNLHKV